LLNTDTSDLGGTRRGQYWFWHCYVFNEVVARAATASGRESISYK
jgi:hypothetical protein